MTKSLWSLETLTALLSSIFYWIFVFNKEDAASVMSYRGKIIWRNIVRHWIRKSWYFQVFLVFLTLTKHKKYKLKLFKLNYNTIIFFILFFV